MSDFQFRREDIDQEVIYHLEGYFNDLAAESVEIEIQKDLEMGIKKYILNFEQSQVINSVGISVLIGIIESIVDENQGKLCICHLNPTNKTTFEMMGLFQDAGYADTLEAAVTLVNSVNEN